MFRISMGIPLDEMQGMSVPAMRDHLDYWLSISEGA